MRFCPQCGHKNPPQAAFCGQCGASFQASAPPPAKAAAAQTVVGMSMSYGADGTPAAPSPEQAPASLAKRGGGKATMLGMPSPLGSPQPPAPVAPAAPAAPVAPVAGAQAQHSGRRLGKDGKSTMLAVPHEASAPKKPAAAKPMLGKGTMLGISPDQLTRPPEPSAQPAPAQPAAAQPAPAADANAPAKRAPSGSMKQTMLGVAAPPMGQPAPQPDQPQPKEAAGAAAPTGQGGGAKHQKTMLGIALPGIAPTGEKEVPSSKPVVKPEYVEEVYEDVIERRGPEQRMRRKLVVKAPPFYKRAPFYAVVAALLLAVVGVLVVVFMPKPSPLSAKAKTDAAGNEFLVIQCPTCPDETKVSLTEGAAASFKNKQATLAVSSPLKVGENSFSLKLDRPGSGRDETVLLKLPIAYRIRPNLSGLQQDTPSIWVEIEAEPGTAVTVGGAAVPLNAQGKARHKVDVSKDLLGAAAGVQTLSKSIPYSVASKGREPARGNLSIRVGIAPLEVTTPGPKAITDKAWFYMGGHIKAGAGLKVGKSDISVKPDGDFFQKMNISRQGETVIRLRTNAPPLAPRLYDIRVRRVANLENETKGYLESSIPCSGAAKDIGAAKGKKVAWEAEVKDARSQNHHTIAIVGVSAKPKAPADCVARLLIPGTDPLKTGDKVRVFGTVSGSQKLDGKTVPEISIDFYLPGKKLAPW